MFIDIVYNMPNWILALTMIGITLLLGVVGLLVVHNLYKNPSGEDNELILGLSHMAGILFAVVVGFIAVTVLGAFDKALMTAENETNQAFTIWVDARAYPSAYESRVRDAMENYLHMVIKTEWSLQSQGQSSIETDRSFENLYRLLIDYVPTSEAQQQIHTQIIQKINKMFEDRANRAFINLHGLSAAVYYVIFMSTLILFGFDWTISAKSFRKHLALTCLLSIGIGLVFFLIVAFDYPFRGEISVSPEAFEKTLEHIQRLKIEQPPSPGI